MKQNRIDPAIVIIVLMILIAVIFGIILSSQIRKDRVTQYTSGNTTVPVLFIVSQDDKILFSHIILSDLEYNRYALFDVPYNLGMILSDLGRVDRISVLFEERGIQAYQDRVSSIFDLEIPFYLHFTVDQFSQFIDMLGGIEISLLDAIDIQDDSDFLRIPNGLVNLDGYKITSLLKFHGFNEEGQDRLSRLFSVTQGLLAQIKDQQPIFDSNYSRALLEGLIDSGLDFQGLQSLFDVFGNLDSEQILTQRVLGTERVVQTQEGSIPLLFPHFEGQLLRDSVRRTMTSLKVESSDQSALGSIRVEVLNGTRIAGLARRTGDLLSNYGVQIIGVGNAETQDVEFTQIIYHTNQQAAQQIGSLIRGQRIIPGSGINPEGADVTLIIGRDFDGLYVR